MGRQGLETGGKTARLYACSCGLFDLFFPPPLPPIPPLSGPAFSRGARPP